MFLGSSVLSIPGLLEVKACGMYSYLKVEDGLHESQDMLFSPSSLQEVMTTAAIIIFIILFKTVIISEKIIIMIPILDTAILLSLMTVLYVPPEEEVTLAVRANLIPALQCNSRASTPLRALFYSRGSPLSISKRPLFLLECKFSQLLQLPISYL